MRILPASDSSAIALFGEEPSPEMHRCVLRLFHRLLALKDPGIRGVHPAYASVLVDFDPLRICHDEMRALLEQLIEQSAGDETGSSRQIEIPVCYEAPFGPDIADVAAHCGIAVEEVGRLHSAVHYTVSFLGFLPGFGYLSGLPERLIVPRLANPRKLVPAGSVGIAGTQAGIYPVDSPGAWRIIGRTPLRMFDPGAEPPALLSYGDRVHFVPIGAAEFETELAKGSAP